MNIEKIADRAHQLIGLLSHGRACYQACLEVGIDSTELKDVAGVVSAILTNRELSQIGGAPSDISQTPEHARAREIVAAWAKANGRTGRANAQTRQSKIRKIIKNGVDSDYARKIIAASKDLT